MMPSAAPQLAFDGGTGAAQVPDTSIVPSEIAPEADATQPEATVPPAPEIAIAPQPVRAEHLRQIELFVLLLTLLSAATFIAWRYHRRDYASPRRIGRRI